jgi:nicotinate phosphoribosyltransferase
MQHPSAVTSSLFTDLYEVTMAQAYLAEGMAGTAVFETFFRKLPEERSYVVAAGLADVLDFLEALRFTSDDLDFLDGLGVFSDDLLRALSALRFTGDVWAVPEGTVVFPHEPIVQVVAPIIEAQLVETFVLNQIHFQSVIASKAARLVHAAAGRAVVDFGARRAHGVDAGLKVARATYLAGGTGTSNLLAARLYGIPALGTMAHSFVQACEGEAAAFAAFVRQFPHATLLVDTYETLQGIDRVIELARQLGDNCAIGAVRLDSGDLIALAKSARAKLDAAGLRDVEVFVSSGLDEYDLAEMVASKSPIDGFGVGTQLATSSDAPYLDMAYKLVEYGGEPRTKLSTEKTLYPGRKQVFRRADAGMFVGDTIALATEGQRGEPLLVHVMANGRRTDQFDGSLLGARSRCAAQVAALPDDIRALRSSGAYPATVSARVLQALALLRSSLQR